MGKMKTSGAVEMECDYFNPSEQTGQLNIRVFGETLVRVAAVFSNPQETIALQCDGIYAANFTKLVAIIPEGDAIRVVLEKE